MDIILASASPRRKDILDIFNKDYIIKIPYADETINSKFSPAINAMHIAFLKTKNILQSNPKATIISADTVVAVGDKIFGKPRSAEDAFVMLSQLSGKKHSVITGFCIANSEKNIIYTDYVKTDVTFRNISNKSIESYLSSNEYADKAGAYAIQGKASVFIDKIEGDYFNIVGLPISEINKVLTELFSYNLI